MTEPISYENRGPVAWVTINRPEARNALNRAAREGVRAAWERFNRRRERGGGRAHRGGDKAFCAGGDLKEMADTSLAIPPRDHIVYLNRTIKVDKPVIAAVNGLAYGGGFLLAMQVDLCIAAEHARFGITESRVGRGSPWAAPLPWLIPPRAAMEMVLTAEPISAARAYELGLVNKVVPADALVAEAERMAGLIADNAPLSVRAGKAMIYASAEMGWSAALETADRIYDRVYLSEDGQEGPRAFKEKRAPQWKGR